MPKFWIKKPTGVVITSNHPLNPPTLPPDDRRVDVCWSPRPQGWKDQDFFNAHFGVDQRWWRAGNIRCGPSVGSTSVASTPHANAVPQRSVATPSLQTARPVQEV